MATIFEGLLTKQPPPPSQIKAGMPPELDRIVFKALEKDRETRYQSAADLRADLKRLKRERDTGQVTASATAAAGPAGTPVAPKPADARPQSSASYARWRRRTVWSARRSLTVALVARLLLLSIDHARRR